MADPGWVRVATLRSPEAFRRHLDAGGIPLSFDDAIATPSDSPLARPLAPRGATRATPTHHRRLTRRLRVPNAAPALSPSHRPPRATTWI